MSLRVSEHLQTPKVRVTAPAAAAAGDVTWLQERQRIRKKRFSNRF
jgi:hypothetical protein